MFLPPIKLDQISFETKGRQNLQKIVDFVIEFTGCIKKNGVHVLCLIISKLLKLIGQFWTCFKPGSFLFRTSRNSYFYSD